MAVASSASILRGVPGRLFWNGTAIGTTRAMTFEPNVKLRDIWAEEFGAPVDRIYCGEYPVFRAILRYNDSDAITAVAPKSPSAGAFLFRPGGTTSNTRAGTSLYGTAGSLVFTPKASAHPQITLYKAIPCWDAAAKIAMALNVEWNLSLVFVGAPNSSGQSYQVG